jgi:hypothetical protein
MSPVLLSDWRADKVDTRLATGFAVSDFSGFAGACDPGMVSPSGSSVPALGFDSVV